MVAGLVRPYMESANNPFPVTPLCVQTPPDLVVLDPRGVMPPRPGVAYVTCCCQIAALRGLPPLRLVERLHNVN